MSYTRSDCGAGGRAVARFDLTNRAPRSGLPPYVTIRADTPPAGAEPGDNSVLLSYYAAATARITRVEVNGTPMRVATQREGDTVVVTVRLELPIGRTQRVAVTVVEPAAVNPPQILRQPLVRPLTVDLRGNRCR